jgi:hypothetical protein
MSRLGIVLMFALLLVLAGSVMRGFGPAALTLRVG